MSRLRQPTLPDFIFLLALLFVVFALAQIMVEYLTLAGEAIRYPYPLDYGEGPVLDQTVRLARGENIYQTDFSTPPYRVSNTPPLFHLVQAPFVTRSGAAFSYGRFISLVSALVCVVLLALIAHRLTGDWVASGIAGVLLLAFPHVAYWSLLNRVDTLALALSLGGLFAVVRWPQRRFGIGLAAGLFVAAIWTKHTYALAGPATAFVWLWTQRLRRQAALLIGIVVSVSLASFLLLNLATSGGLFLNAIVANVNAFSGFQVVGSLVNLFVHAAFIIIGGVLFLVLERTTVHTRSWSFVLIYVVFASFAALASGKVGSNVNYLYELVAAICLLTGAAIAWVGGNTWLKVGALAVVALQLTDLREWSQEAYFPLITGKIELRREVAQLSERVQRAEGDVLADEYLGLLPLHNRRIFMQPFEFTQLQEAGLWNDGQLVAQINRRAFSIVALYEPLGQPALIVQRWTPRVRQAIYDNYELSNPLGEALIYVPKRP